MTNRSGDVAQSLILLLGVLGALVVIAMLWRGLRKNSPTASATVQMTDVERREALLLMRQWLDGDAHVLKAEVRA